MPYFIRDDIRAFLYDVATFLRRISYRFEDAADWAADIPGVGYYIAYALYKAADYCYDANYIFKDLMWAWLDLCNWLDNLWDDLDDLWDYAHTTLRNIADNALSAASDALSRVTVAYNKAVDAWNYATGWLTDFTNEAWSRAGEVWGNVTNYLKDLAINAFNKAVWAYEQIALAVTAKAQEIYGWVRSIPAEIRAFIEGVIADFRAWVEPHTLDIVTAALLPFIPLFNLISYWFDDIQDFFNDPLGTILGWLLGLAKKHEGLVVNIFDRVMNTLWGE